MQRTPTLALVVAIAVGLGTLAVQADPNEPTPIPTTLGEAIIGFHEGMMPELKPGDRYAGMLVTQVVEQGGFIVVRATDLAVAGARVEGLTEVAYVEDNGLLHAFYIPNDTRYGEQWGPQPMGFETAWAAGLGSADVTVAVLDTGIRKTHNDFVDANILQGHDYVNDDNDPNDDCGHGTHVSGTVAAHTNNALGVAGMSQSKILHMKVLSPLLFLTCSGSNADIADAIYDSTDQGADIISMSLGGSGGSSTLLNAVNYAWNNGVLVVAAAGNGNGGAVNYPAAYDAVIAVSALDEDLTIASYSSVGPQVEVTAPGTDVLSTYSSNDNSYSSLSGTSMATPHVAGALALAMSQSPGHTAQEIRDALRSTAQDLGPAGRDNNFGYGLVRVDLLVNELGGTPPPPPPGNDPPTAAFTYTTSGLTVDVDGSGSSDPNGHTLTYAWDFGDGASGSGVTASHTYSAAGTYTVTLTVDDGNGASDTEIKQVTVTNPGDPDPSTPTIQSGQQQTVPLSGTGDEEFFKVFVPSGSSNLEVVMTGPGCSLLNCPLDADLYTRYNARPTDSQYDCRPYLSGNNEDCNHSSPTGGWWYIRADSYSGSGTVYITATVT